MPMPAPVFTAILTPIELQAAIIAPVKTSILPSIHAAILPPIHAAIKTPVIATIVTTLHHETGPAGHAHAGSRRLDVPASVMRLGAR
jgi:hypothetical protein